MSIQSAYITTMRHKSKRYETYLLESQAHNKSITDKYGMPPKAKPPQLPDDIVERVIKQTYVSKKMWVGL